MNNFDSSEDDYIIELFLKRCPDASGKVPEDKEEPKKKKELSEIEKLFQSSDCIKYDREDVFFSEIEEDGEEDDFVDEEEEEEKKKKKKEEKKEEEGEEEEPKKKVNLLKFCQISNPALQGRKFYRTAYQDQFRSLFNNEYLSDITLLAKTYQAPHEWKKIHCHKLILTSRCEYFKKLFSTPLRESHEKEVKMEHVAYEILSSLLEYLYTGVLEVTYQTSLLLLAAANQFLLSDVKEVLCVYFEKIIDADVACMLYEESFFHNAPSLRKSCLAYIEAHSEEVVFSDAFKRMTTEMVREIIKSDYLCVDEYKLFEGLLSWAKTQFREARALHGGEGQEETEGEAGPDEKVDMVEVKKYLDQVIEFVRFPLMKPLDLRDQVEKKYPDLVPPTYIMEAYRYHALGNVISPRTRPRLTQVHFVWDDTKKSTYIRLDSDKLEVTTTYMSNRATTCVGNEIFTKPGLYYWEVTLDNVGANCALQIGVTDRTSVSTENYLSYHRRGWALMTSTGNKYYNSRGYPYYKKGKMKKGDVIGVLLNLTEKSLSFYVNGESFGVAFKDVTPPLSPAVTLFQPQDKVTLNTHVKPPKRKKNQEKKKE